MNLKSSHFFALLFNLFVSVNLIAQTSAVIGDLAVSRYGHTATLFGELTGNEPILSVTLVVGGSDGISVLDNAEVDGIILPISVPRMDHTATYIPAVNYILIAGGYDGDVTNHSSTDLFDPETLEFVEGPEMAYGRSNHRATLLSDGRVVITGGYDGSINLAACEIYDPATALFSTIAPMNQGRSSHTASLLSDGRVLVTGGFNPDYGFQMNSCEIYDPVTNTWTLVAPMSVARDNHAASDYEGLGLASWKIAVSGGRSYNPELNLFEGLSSVELYDPDADTWEPLESTQTGHSYHTMFDVSNGLFIAGGVDHTGFEVEQTFGRYEYKNYQDGDPWEDIYGGSQQPIVEGRFKSASVLRWDMSSDVDVYTFGGVDSFGYGQTVNHTNFHLLNVPNIGSDGVLVFPNPSSGRFAVRASFPANWHASLRDASGRELRSINFQGSELVVNDLSPGLYHIHLSMDRHSIVKRIVIN